MNTIRFLCLLTVIFCAACSKVDPDPIGSISFTSTRDCEMRLFDSRGRQVAHEQLETSKPPVSVNMKSTGIFIVHAVSDSKTVKEPLTYTGGNIEYCIEF